MYRQLIRNASEAGRSEGSVKQSSMQVVCDGFERALWTETSWAGEVRFL